jgi:hypothetical protein
MLQMRTQADRADQRENSTESAAPDEGRRFAVELDRTLRRIGAQRVRVSLASMMLPEGVGDRRRLAALIAHRITSASVLAGVDSDGAVLVASFGPRRFGPSGDADEARYLSAAFRDALNHLVPKALGRTAVSVGHFWSDEWVGVAPISCRTLLPQVIELRMTPSQLQELAIAS